MHILDPCMPIFTGGHTRTHDVARRIVGTRNRTHVHMDATQPRARSPPIHHESIHLSIDIGRVYRSYILCTHMARFYTRARARTHRHSWPRARAYCTSQG